MTDFFNRPSDDEDRMIVSAIQRGDQRAFEVLIRKFEKLVVSIVFRMIQQTQDREDICQDVFMNVFDKLNTFQYRSRLSTWIGNIAFNRCVNFLEKKKLIYVAEFSNDSGDDEASQIRQEENLIRDESPHPEQALMNKEAEQRILQGLENLPVAQKTVITLFHQLDLSLEEVSQIMNLPVNTVKSHLFRGRKALRMQINNS